MHPPLRFIAPAILLAASITLFAQEPNPTEQPMVAQPEAVAAVPEPEQPAVAPQPEPSAPTPDVAAEEPAPAPIPARIAPIRQIRSPRSNSASLHPLTDIAPEPQMQQLRPQPLPQPDLKNTTPQAPRIKSKFSTGSGDEMIPSIQFPNALVQSVLEFYEKLTGKKVLYDATVQGNVNIVVKQEVSKEEAIRLIETALSLNGFTLVPGPGDIVKVLGVSKNPRSFAIPIFSELDEIPDGDQLISFLFKLEYADPTEVTQAILQYIVPSTYTASVALPKSQAVLVTETSSVIRNLARFIASIDRKPADVVSEFITLERADAKEVLEKLNAVFEKKEQTGTAVPVARPPGEPPDPNAPVPDAGAVGTATTLSEDSLIVGKIKLTADVRTNRIHVVTRPINMPFIRRLISEFDTDTPFGEPTTRPLRFVAAADVLDIVVKAITEPGGKTEEGGGNRAQNPATPTNTGTPSYGNSGQGGRTGTDLGISGLSTSSVNTAPEARTVGNAKIIADNRSNAIIVLGNQEIKDKIFKVLDQIDVRAPQVMLTAVIGELALNEGEEFGIDYLLHSPLASGSNVIGRGIHGVSKNSGLDLSSILSAAALPSTGGGLTALIGVSKSLDIIVHALESTGRFHITSRPMVFTSNNKKATIASGEQVPVPGTIQSGYGGTSNLNNGLVSNTNVDYKDVLLKLEVLPLINSDREVTLDIVQQVNNIGDSTIIGGNAIPTITTRAIQTTVSVANEATVVLGGLVTESLDKSKSGLPILSRIPIIGPLFGNKKKTMKRSELIVLIRPTVTMGAQETTRAGEKVQEKMSFPPDLDATLDPPGKRLKLDAQPLLVPPKATLRSPK